MTNAESSLNSPLSLLLLITLNSVDAT